MVAAAANAISGEKSVGESMSDELSNARKQISSALKKANQQRKLPVEVSGSAKKRKAKGKRKTLKKGKRNTVRRSVFDDDDD